LHPVAEALQAGRASSEARHAHKVAPPARGPPGSCALADDHVRWEPRAIVLDGVDYQSPSDGAGSNALRSGASPMTARAAFTP
jgi:hypothetical protein